jgi:hypothetical protein
MKKIFYIFLSTVFHSLLYGQAVSKDLASMSLKGKISFVLESEYEAKLINGVYVKGEKRSEYEYKFNTRGNKTMLSNLYSHPSITEYKYDSNHFLIEEKMTTGKSVIQYKIANSAQGKPVEIKTFYESGNTGSLQKYTYNSYGLLNMIEIFDEDKSVNREIYKYTANGELLSKSNRESEIDFTIFGDSYSYLEEYDGYGNIIKKKSLSLWDENNSISLYTYDKNNLLTEYQFTNMFTELKEEEKTTFEYTFDEQGNWIKRVGTVKSNLPDKWQITERKINYYK